MKKESAGHDLATRIAIFAFVYFLGDALLLLDLFVWKSGFVVNLPDSVQLVLGVMYFPVHWTLVTTGLLPKTIP